MKSSPDTDALWILAIPCWSPEDLQRISLRLTELCEWPPVELETPGDHCVWLEGYVENEIQARLIWKALEQEMGKAIDQASLRPCPKKDWTTFWRHHFKARAVGETLYILPEWLRGEPLSPEAADRQRVLVNPGLSFGTGDHFTTRYCLEQLDRLVVEGVKPEQVLDAGCGSAIISVAAHKLGWRNILAVDFDPVAVEQAKENLVLNGITSDVSCEVMDLTRQTPPGKYDVVFANLYGGLLMDLAPKLIALTRHTLILSGIRAIEADAVSSVFAQLGAIECSSDCDHEWCGLHLRISQE